MVRAHACVSTRARVRSERLYRILTDRTAAGERRLVRVRTRRRRHVKHEIEQQRQ